MVGTQTRRKLLREGEVPQLRTSEKRLSTPKTTYLGEAILFALACFISFSMGSTFGTFGLILPIAAGIVASVDISLLIPAFGAVLAGAIFGDHTSPLSDTTILSSVGSGIHLIDHVTTQIPYALVCAAASLAGYIVLGFTRNITVGLLTTLAALAVAVFVLRSRFGSETQRESDAERVAG